MMFLRTGKPSGRSRHRAKRRARWAAREGIEMPIVDTVNRRTFPRVNQLAGAIAALMTKERLRAEVDR